MINLGSSKRRKLICERVRQVRYERHGSTRGAQKEAARDLGIPYTTYRGYEENRTNMEFLKVFAKKFGVQLLWLLGEDGTESKKNTSEPVLTINPEKNALSSPLYRIVQVQDDAMEPAISKGAWVGSLPVLGDDALDRKIVLLEISPGKIVPRRIFVKNRLMLGIADNPNFSKNVVTVHKKDLIGKVVWQFSKI